MKRVILAAVFMMILSTAFSAGEVKGADLTNPSVVSDVTNRMMNGLPTTLDEQLGVAAPGLFGAVTPSETGYIIIGDSRMTGLNVACNVNSTPDNWFVVACAGVHLNYLNEVAIPAADNLRASHPEIGHWKYIINLGLTDLDKAKTYANMLSNLAATRDVYFMSVNPTNITAVTSLYQLTNDRIAAFNKAVAAYAPGVKYLDTYDYLIQTGFKTAEDGFHYDNPTTQRIYDAIKAGVMAM
ncbi:MAG: hypothetical protein K6E49_03915 [Lachnospiraceae bacterium]|nr:hypothetical protein [Lachnospiraceae bacterium]